MAIAANRYERVCRKVAPPKTFSLLLACQFAEQSIILC
jgi:hypothetical protein